MITLIVESAGDIKLCKFIGIISDRLPEISDNYFEDFNGYFFQEEYFYNILTRTREKDFITHSDMIDALPEFLRHKFKYDENVSVWGMVDYRPAIKRNPLILYISNSDILTDKQKNFINKRVKAYLNQAISS